MTAAKYLVHPICGPCIIDGHKNFLEKREKTKFK